MIEDTKHINKILVAGIIGAGLLIAAMIFIMRINGSLPANYYPQVIAFSYVSSIIIQPLLLFLATKYSSFKLPALVWLHVSMGVMIVFFSETYSPFSVLWAILILVSSIYYSWKGFVASSLALVLTGVAYISVFPDFLRDGFTTYCFLSVLIVSLTIFMSYIFVAVIATSQKKNRDLMKSQQSEFLQVNRLHTLLNSISDAVMTLNRYGRITSQNAAAQALFDTNESLIGRNIDGLLKMTDRNEEPVHVRHLIDEIKSTILRDDVSIPSYEGTRHLSVQLARIRSTFDDDEEYGVVIIIRDITKQKTLEEEKDEFISVTSHELRTPVAIAEGSLSNLLLMFERDVKPEKLSDAAKAAHDQIIYLAKIINDLSTLSRAERGVGDTLETINTGELIQQLYQRYTAEAEEKNLHLNLDIEADLPQITTSRLYLEEILQNFVTNSIKYTKEGSVTMIAKKQPVGTIKFSVSDTGIGISKADQERIFEKFYRSEDYRTRETSGTGLGLYVVKKLAAKLGTTIDVESRLNNGSTFSFELPIESKAKPAKPAVDMVPKEDTQEEPQPVEAAKAA